MPMNSRKWLQVGIVAAILCQSKSSSAGETISPEQARRDDNGVSWYDVNLLDVEGRAWSELKSPFDRLPAKAEGVVRDAVWGLSRHSAGMRVRFVTDADAIHAAWTLTSARLAMPHMPATGVSGLDLYVRDDEGTWRWLANKPPSGQSTTVQLVSGIPAGTREYALYLPLYNGVTAVEIGVPEGASLKTPPDFDEGHEQPIVFYGTSITHGACASRPGTCHPAILGRRFERPVVNLGFSGNGRMELEVAELMAEIDAAVYVIDCLPNIGADDVTARTGPLVRLLREKRPETPILLVEDRTYSDAFLLVGKRRRNDTSRAALRTEYQKLIDDGVSGLYYLEGEHLLGDDNEGTVDSSHPTDLGFMRQADAFAVVFREILGGRDAE